MNKTSSKTKKLWKRIVVFTLLIPILFFSAILFYVYSQQDAIVQSQVESLNLTMNGKIQVADTHLEPFQNFPYVSIKIDHVQIFESKAENSAIILYIYSFQKKFLSSNELVQNNGRSKIYSWHNFSLQPSMLNTVTS